MEGLDIAITSRLRKGNGIFPEICPLGHRCLGAPILCCPEAVRGGLADYAEDPAQFEITASVGRLASAVVGAGGVFTEDDVAFSAIHLTTETKELYEGRPYRPLWQQ